MSRCVTRKMGLQVKEETTHSEQPYTVAQQHLGREPLPVFRLQRIHSVWISCDVT